MRIHRGLLILLGIWGALCAWARAHADDGSRCTAVEPSRALFSGRIGLIGSSELPRGVVERAVRKWVSCPGYGRDFPAFVIGGKGIRSVEVRFASRGVGRRSGSFVGRTMEEQGALRYHPCPARSRIPSSSDHPLLQEPTPAPDPLRHPRHRPTGNPGHHGRHPNRRRRPPVGVECHRHPRRQGPGPNPRDHRPGLQERPRRDAARGQERRHRVGRAATPAAIG